MTAAGLLVCGLGTDPRRDATVESLLHLEECRVVFSDLPEPEILEWLRDRCQRLERVRGEGEVLRAARKGGPVGLAVWGHPLFSSRLSHRLLKRCRDEGIPFQVVGAVSPVGSSLARSLSHFNSYYGYPGVQAYELGTFLSAPPDLIARLPLVVYSQGAPPPEAKARLAELLARRYGPRHLVWLTGPGQACGPKPLAEHPDPGPGGFVLFIPPAPAARLGRGKDGC